MNRCMLCGAEYEGQHTCPNIRVNFWPNYPVQVYTWYKCPNCRGEFSQWDAIQSAGTTMLQYCPFCGMEKGKYPEKMDVGK